MAPPVRYLRPGEQADLHAWLFQKLQEERREVLLSLEEKHRSLMDQFESRLTEGDIASRQSSMPRLGNNLVPSPKATGNDPVQETNEVWDKVVDEDNEEKPPDDTPEARPAENAAQPLQKEYNHELDHGASTTTLLPRGAPTGFEATPRGQAFEWFCGSLIFANAIVMAFNQQYQGLQRGYELKIRTYESAKEDSWPGAELAFEILEFVFTIAFTTEFCLRIVIYKLKFFKEFWCYFDLTIVVIAWIMLFNRDLIQFNPTFVRLARVSKLLRLVRLLRSQEILDSLKLLVAAINASFNTLFWSLCILGLIISVNALFMGQLLESFIDADNKDEEIQRRVFKYFGTFWRSLMTMVEITFANWVPSCRLLLDHVSEAYGMFYLAYRCLVGLAVLMVVQAVFIQQTMKTTQLDDEYLAHQKATTKVKLLRRLERMFRKLDESGDGQLEWAEFSDALQDPDMKGMLEVFELEVSDLDQLFRLLDDGDGKISTDEFIAGVEHMKGPARGIDMMALKQDLKRVKDQVLAMPIPR